LAVCGILVIAAPAASADPKIPFSQDVYARTHLAKSGLDITVPPGQFDGTIDLATGEETGTLTLPPATPRRRSTSSWPSSRRTARTSTSWATAAPR
jgi:hypothetical protein